MEELDWTAPAPKLSAWAVRTRWEVMAYVLVPQSPGRAWSFIHPAEHAPVTDPDLVRAFRRASTPVGLGERQTFVYRSGLRTTIEVVEFVPGRRAVTNHVFHGEVVPGVVQTVQTVDPDGTGTRLGLGYRLPPGARRRARLPRRRPLLREVRRQAAALARWDAATP